MTSTKTKMSPADLIKEIAKYNQTPVTQEPWIVVSTFDNIQIRTITGFLLIELGQSPQAKETCLHIRAIHNAHLESEWQKAKTAKEESV